MRRFLVVASVLALWAPLAHSQCDCGYSIHTPTDPSYAVFTDIHETDFLHLPEDSLDWDKRNASGWAYQVYVVSPQAARGPYGKKMAARNVVLNPMKSVWDWAGPTAHGGDGGMQIWVRARTEAGIDENERVVPGGEVSGIDADKLFGSYRVGVKWTGTAGTCGAFFWYQNNSQEIDMEYLSWQQAPNASTNATFHAINLVNQSPESVRAGFDAAGTAGFDLAQLAFQPDAAFHEYRFDWTPGKVSFFADGVWLHDMLRDIPEAPGQLFLNHWSNGDAAWSAGPPASDAVLTVSYVKAYFNSTDPAKIRAYSDRCSTRYAGADLRAHTCRIPDQTVAPDQAGPRGNDTARTFFFSDTQTRRNGGGAVDPAGWRRGVAAAALAVGIAWRLFD